MSTDIPLRFIGLSPASLVVGHQVDKAIKPYTVFGYKLLFCLFITTNQSMQFLFTKSFKSLSGLHILLYFYLYRKPSTILAYLGAISMDRQNERLWKWEFNAVDGMYTDSGTAWGQCTILMTQIHSNVESWP